VKGLVFTEFIEMVDERFSLETSERLIEECDLPSSGAYTSIGTYDAAEMRALVTRLSEITGIPVSDLLNAFGRHLFNRFTTSFPDFFEGIGSALEFLPRVNDYVHLEVRKLYPDASLPTFSCAFPDPGTLVMTYRSATDLPDLAQGLIEGCAEHFGESLVVTRETPSGDPPVTLFTVRRA
jgi:hypothetical protein